MFNFLKDFGFPAYVVGVITLITLGYKRIKELQEHNLKSTKEQLDSITELFTNEQKLNNKFLVEQVFQYKFKSYIPAKIIFLLLHTENPTSSFKDYIFGKRYLKCDIDDTNISYSKEMKCGNYRKKWFFINLVGYFIFAFIGLGGLLYLTKIDKYLGFPWFVASIPLVLYFLWVAYEFIMSALRIKAAEKIMNEIEYKEIHNDRVNLDG